MSTGQNLMKKLSQILAVKFHAGPASHETEIDDEE